jgi:regulatory protein
LLAKGYDSALVTAVVERLVAEKLLDDRRYLVNFVAYHAARGHGPKRVRADLSKLGMDGVLVEGALNDYPDWIVHLQSARRKKFGSRLPAGNADKLREIRFLGYRGFTSAQIRMALGFDTNLESDDDNL